MLQPAASCLVKTREWGAGGQRRALRSDPLQACGWLAPAASAVLPPSPAAPLRPRPDLRLQPSSSLSRFLLPFPQLIEFTAPQKVNCREEEKGVGEILMGNLGREVFRVEMEIQGAPRDSSRPCTQFASPQVTGSARLSQGSGLIGHFLRALFAIYVKSNSQNCPFFVIWYWQ